MQQGVEFGVERLVDPRLPEGVVEFVERGDERLGNEPAPVLSEVPLSVGQTHCADLLVGVTDGWVLPCGHQVLHGGRGIGLGDQRLAH